MKNNIMVRIMLKQTIKISFTVISLAACCQYQMLLGQAKMDDLKPLPEDDSIRLINIDNILTEKSVLIAQASSQEDKNNSSTLTNDASSSESSDSQHLSDQNNVLKGKVKGAAILTLDGLNAITTDSKILQGSTYQIMRECTRKQTINLGQPNYIGNGIVIPAIGGPTGTMQMGGLPARKAKLDNFFKLTQEAFAALENHIDALIIPPDATEEMHNLYMGMKNIEQATRENINKMNTLIQEPKMQTKEIGRTAVHVYDSMTALEKIEKQLTELIKKNS